MFSVNKVVFLGGKEACSLLGPLKTQLIWPNSCIETQLLGHVYEQASEGQRKAQTPFINGRKKGLSFLCEEKLSRLEIVQRTQLGEPTQNEPFEWKRFMFSFGTSFALPFGIQNWRCVSIHYISSRRLEIVQRTQIGEPTQNEPLEWKSFMLSFDTSRRRGRNHYISTWTSLF